MEEEGFNVLNIKAPPYSAYTAEAKIDSSNKIAKESDVNLHMAVHADARGESGFAGIDVYYIAGAEISEKIAQHFVDALAGAGFSSRTRSDAQSGPGKLGELRSTDAPAVYFEIGNMQSSVDRANMLSDDYMDRMASTIAQATRSFVDEKVNQ